MNEQVPRSVEILVAVLQERLDNHNRQMLEGFAQIKIDMSELTSAMKALESRESERNGHIRNLISYRQQNEERNGEHLLRHQEQEERQTKALEKLTLLVTPLLDQAKVAKIRGLVWKQIGGGAAAGAGFVGILVGILVKLGDL